MASESESPDAGLVGTSLAQRSESDVIVPFFGHEVRLMSPIWIPEAIKNSIIDRMRDRFQTAFPGIDFSQVKNDKLHHIGIQSVFAMTPKEEALISKKSREVALTESLTQIVSTYATLVWKGKPVSLNDLGNSGIGYDGDIDRTTSRLVRAVSLHHLRHVDELPPYQGPKLDQVTRETAQTIARAYFSGNLDELRTICQKETEYGSLDALLEQATDPKSDQKNIHIQKPPPVTMDWTVAGLYCHDTNQTAIIFSMTGALLAKISRFMAGAVERIAPRGLKAVVGAAKSKYPAKDAYRALSLITQNVNMHEFAHFFSVHMWERQPPDRLDPLLRSLSI